MMVDPQDQDKEEARQKRKVYRPLLEQLRQQTSLLHVTRLRHLHIQHQQGDGNGKHAITKGFDAPGFLLISLHNPRQWSVHVSHSALLWPSESLVKLIL